jgi:hypothetical protein
MIPDLRPSARALSSCEETFMGTRRAPGRLATWALFATALTAAEAAAQGVEYRRDFRGGAAVDDAALAVQGPDAATRIKPDAEGLRMTLPEKQEKPDRIGLKTKFGVRGDFTIAASYQILDAPRPQRGAGVGFLLYLVADTATESGFAFFRVQRVEEGDSYVCSRRTPLPERGQRKTEDEVLPAAGASGQLRVTRTGSEIIVSVTEEGDAERELRRYEFGRGDLKRVEVAAYPGRASYPVDLRVVDWLIRAESLPGLPEAANQVAPAAPGGRAGTVLALLLLAGLGLALGVFLARSRNRPRGGAAT